MSKWIFFTVFAASLTTVLAAERETGGIVYEERVYYAPEGKLDELHARFRNHTMKLFEKHGIRNIAYFVPAGENPERKLIYFLSYPSREAREKSWKAFNSDPEWQNARAKSEKNGKLVAKAEQYFLVPTDYSPELKMSDKGSHVFELRAYTTPEGKLPELDARFKNHTIALFKKHGMQNVVYWHRMEDQKDAKTTLVYLLAHKSLDAGKASFAEFRNDADWLKAKTESEKNGPLTVQNGVKSEYLVPTDYSPLK